MPSHFYAYLGRMKLIRRLGLMHAVQPENDMEHALQVALIAHALALMGNARYQRGSIRSMCWHWRCTTMRPRS